MLGEERLIEYWSSCGGDGAEGALNKVVATADLMELEPNLELARECLG